MVTFQDLLTGKDSLSVVGLGYVGLPVAVAFARKIKVIGFDVNEDKIKRLNGGTDSTGEVKSENLKNTTVKFTSDPACLREARFHIVAVPTPVGKDKTPDLGALESACAVLGRNLSEGSAVVFESTVYPGVTEEVCVPILEKESGLICGRDFKVGYSPERISPGDEEHRLETIVKIVSGMDDETLDLIADVYTLVVDAGVYRAESIKVAEAAKVIENSQRDLNIAFMNELSLIFKRLGLDTLEVLRAAGTKWNFLNFRPGLVGGHCIGVDPYYLTYRSQQTGYHPQVILAGRSINDNMGRYVAENAVKILTKNDVTLSRCKVVVMGLTFKENCPDTRNTRVIDIIDELREYGADPKVCDPVADAEEAFTYYQIELTKLEEVEEVDCLILAVMHKEFASLNISAHLKSGGLLVDVKGIFEPSDIERAGFAYWRL